jgi:hypothetical protein
MDGFLCNLNRSIARTQLYLKSFGSETIRLSVEPLNHEDNGRMRNSRNRFVSLRPNATSDLFAPKT